MCSKLQIQICNFNNDSNVTKTQTKLTVNAVKVDTYQSKHIQDISVKCQLPTCQQYGPEGGVRGDSGIQIHEGEGGEALCSEVQVEQV